MIAWNKAINISNDPCGIIFARLDKKNITFDARFWLDVELTVGCFGRCEDEDIGGDEEKDKEFYLHSCKGKGV